MQIEEIINNVQILFLVYVLIGASMSLYWIFFKKLHKNDEALAHSEKSFFAIIFISLSILWPFLLFRSQKNRLQ